jgi:large subunit ribosomal protein L32
MAHPKRKISKTRRDKRRTNIKLTPKTTAIDPTTGEVHQYHRAHWVDGKLYYKGQVVMERDDLA